MEKLIWWQFAVCFDGKARGNNDTFTMVTKLVNCSATLGNANGEERLLKPWEDRVDPQGPQAPHTPSLYLPHSWLWGRRGGPVVRVYVFVSSCR